MSNELMKRDDDDGFNRSINSGRLLKGTPLKWSDTYRWVDRDGLVPPSPLLVVGVNEVLQKWKDNKPEVIDDKPLPDPEELNSAIPVGNWEIGLDGKPRPPWQHTVVVYLVNLGTGEFHTYANATVGAHMAYDHLREAVITMRALRGTRAMPLVNLSERPMKTKFGMKQRPHFEIVGWKTPGEDSAALPSKPTPQLAGPATVVPTTSNPAPPDPTLTVSSPAAPAPTPPRMQLSQLKPAVNLAADTVAAMGDVNPVSLHEELNDRIPW